MNRNNILSIWRNKYAKIAITILAFAGSNYASYKYGGDKMNRNLTAVMQGMLDLVKNAEEAKTKALNDGLAFSSDISAKVANLKAIYDEEKSTWVKKGKADDNLINAQKDMIKLLESQKGTSTNASAAISSPPSETTQAEPSPPAREMTNEEKLAAYTQYGIQGIPPAISKQIVDAAKGKWFNNAGVACNVIQEQAQGYVMVQEYKTKAIRQIPYNIKTQIVNDAAVKYANDYQYMAKQISEQAVAYEQVQKFYTLGMPGSTIQASRIKLDDAKSRWGGDWEMILSSASR